MLNTWLHPHSPPILVAAEGFSLEAWQIGAVAFAFIGLILIVTFLL